VINEVVDNRRKTIEVENVVETGADRSEDKVELETVVVEESVDVESMRVNEKSVEGSSKKQVEKGQNWRKIEEGIPLKHVPYPHVPFRREAERQFIRFTEILKNLQINIPFTETMQQMPTYARFLKELFTKKRKFPKDETVEFEAGCSAIIQKVIPHKSSDPRSFTLPITVGNLYMGKALLDLGASINLILLSMLRRIGEVEVRPTHMTLQLADRSIKRPYGIVEDLLVKVDKFLSPVDFVVMDIEEDVDVP